MTKMLGGAGSIKHSLHKEEGASLVVANAAFVGVQEHFTLSVHLFHAKFGGEEHASQTIPARAGRFKNISSVLTSLLDRMPFFDRQDEALYSGALQRFGEEVQQYLPQCITPHSNH